MRYAALFRGLNVGGKNRVEMEALRTMLRGLGLEQVRTYIQSGNALFESPKEEAALGREIREAFLMTFGFASPVILRTSRELAALVKGVPFSPQEIALAREEAAGAESLYCYLLQEPLSNRQTLPAPYPQDKDRMVARGREMYLLCHRSIRFSKAAASLEKLSLPMTCRSLKTLEKLLTLVE